MERKSYRVSSVITPTSPLIQFQITNSSSSSSSGFCSSSSSSSSVEAGEEEVPEVVGRVVVGECYR